MIHDMLNPWSASKIPSLSGRVAVVTGGNEGIAAAAIAEFFKHDIAKVCSLDFPEHCFGCGLEQKLTYCICTGHHSQQRQGTLP